MNTRNPFFDLERWRRVMQVVSQLPADTNCQISKLSLAHRLKNGQGDYIFNFNKDIPNRMAGDIVLDRSDCFIPVGFGLGFQFDTIERTGRAKIETYPIAASTAARGFINPDHAEAIFNGIFEIKFNTETVAESFPTEMFRTVPETQPIISKDSADAPYSVGLVPMYDFDRFIKPIPGELYMQGDVDTTFRISFNGTGANFDIAEASAPTTVSTTNAAYLRFMAYGFLMKSGSMQAKDMANKFREVLSRSI